MATATRTRRARAGSEPEARVAAQLAQQVRKDSDESDVSSDDEYGKETIVQPPAKRVSRGRESAAKRAAAEKAKPKKGERAKGAATKVDKEEERKKKKREYARKKREERKKQEEEKRKVDDDDDDVDSEKDNDEAETDEEIPARKPKVNMASIQAILKDLNTFADDDKDNPMQTLRWWSETRLSALRITRCDEETLDELMKLSLRAKMSSSALEWFERHLEQAGLFEWGTFCEEFEARFASPERILKWETKLQERKQKDDETPEQYAQELRKIARVVGRKDSDLFATYLLGLHAEISQKVRETRPKTLDDAIDKAQAV